MKIIWFVLSMFCYICYSKPITTKNKRKTTTSTLMGYSISTKHPLRYYTPYLFKANLIYFEEDLSYSHKYDETHCTDPHCHFCKNLFPEQCVRCATGYFLHLVGCYDYCPEGFFADILKGKCVSVFSSKILPLNQQNFNLPNPQQPQQEISFMKAYSIGSCLNMCGKMTQDCSCSPSCKFKGNCCTDYQSHNCDRIVEKSIIAKESCSLNSNCDMCDDFEKVLLPHTEEKKKVPRCNQCIEGYYLYHGNCYKKCPQDTIEDFNFTCKEIKSILIILKLIFSLRC
jgi:hypothetical protein